MSIKALSWVWDNSEYKGSKLLLLLAIADHCDDYGVCYPGVTRLAKKARIGNRQVQKYTKDFEKQGDLAIEANTGIETKHGKTNRYYLNKYRVAMGLDPYTPEITIDRDDKRVTKYVPPKKETLGGELDDTSKGGELDDTSRGELDDTSRGELDDTLTVSVSLQNNRKKKDSMPVQAYIDLSHEQCLSNLKGILVNEGKVAGRGKVSAYAIADKIAKALLKRDITPLQVLYMYRHFALINSGLTPPQKADTIQEHVDIMLNSYDTGAQYKRALTGIETGAIIDPATFHHYYRQKTQEQEIEAIPDDIEDDPDFDIFGMLADMRQEQLAQEAQIVDEIEQRRLERQKWLEQKLQEVKNETTT